MFPVFSLIALGYLIGRWITLDLRTIINIVLYMAGPSLVFTALVNAPITYSNFLLMGSATLVLMFGVGAIVKIGSAIAKTSPGPLYLPAIFFNAGNMLLPVSFYAFGSEGLALAAVVTAIGNLIGHTCIPAFTTGIANWRQAYRIPYVHAAILGMIVHQTDAAIPLFIMRTIDLLAGAAIPLMLLALGMRLSTAALTSSRWPPIIAAARMVGGLLLAFAFVHIFAVDDPARAVILLTGAMPSAIVAFIYAEKFATRTDEIAATVALTTITSIVTISIVLGVTL